MSAQNQLQEYKRRREKELSEIRSVSMLWQSASILLLVTAVQLQGKDHHNLDYYLSMSWVLQWQRFIHGKTLGQQHNNYSV